MIVLSLGGVHAPALLHFHPAIHTLLCGRWKGPRPATDQLLREHARTKTVQVSVASLVAATFSTPMSFVRAYSSATLDPFDADPRSPAPPWPTPSGVTRTRLLHSIVAKGWQPRDEDNDFSYWKSTLAPSGQACVTFATELLEVEEFEVRDYLAGLAQGMDPTSPGHWLAPEFPQPTTGGAA